MEKYIDQFWLINIERKEKEEERQLSVGETDAIIHDMIHQLFLMTEDQS